MSEENLALWDKMKTPPSSALREIKGGRMSGKTDIDPMWRIRVLTERYGPCGAGWWYTVDNKWKEEGANGEVMCFVDISLYIEGFKHPIPANGGNKLVMKEREGMHNSDEGYKMATTDALGTAMKMLGVGADVYMGKFDGSKYRDAERPKSNVQKAAETFNAKPTPTPEQVVNDPHVFGGGAEEGAPITGGPVPQCPVCSGDMWDNRIRRAEETKAYKSGSRTSKPGPAFRCKRGKECDGVVWSYTQWLDSQGGAA